MTTPLPPFIEPMLAVYGEAFDSDLHIFEPKWDGIRCQLRFSGETRLFSRNGRDITENFPEVAATRIVNGKAYLLDGELICLGPSGTPSFDLVRDRLLMRHRGKIRAASASTPALYVAFDMLYCEGRLMLNMPLLDRRLELEGRFAKGPGRLLSPITDGTGKALFAAIAQQNMEGIVAKERNSPYLPGRRSRSWVKVRRTRTDVFWIIGYAMQGSSLRSLALGEGPSSDVRYAGHVGSGLGEATRSLLASKLRVARNRSPESFSVPKDARASSVWVEPAYRCQVEYLERSPKGGLRHPVFRGLTDEVSDTDREG